MDVVILHYHLNRGGVTRVIENHLKALDGVASPPARVLIVYGGRDADWDPSIEDDVSISVERVVVPELDYDELKGRDRKLSRALFEMLAAHRCSPDSTVLHIHNHGLGKNTELPEAIHELAGHGWRVLLQVHDFAEDLRPANYRAILGSGAEAAARLYPLAEHIHYSVLNDADRLRLLAAHIPEDRLHLLPNAVVQASGSDFDVNVDGIRATLRDEFGVPTSHQYVLYPVRGIRRKNVGELLLWAALTDNTTFGITLEPLNPDERASFDRWATLGNELDLHVAMGVGKSLGLAENLAAADAVITTSVAEGFGLVFLEASLARRQLVGRDLQGVTGDFRAAGMRFPGLAEEMLVPARWLDVQRLKQQLFGCLSELAQAFDVPIQTEYWNHELDRIIGGDAIDFGRLDSLHQAEVVRRAVSDPDARQELRELNPVVSLLSDMATRSANAPMTEDCIQDNIEAIGRSYSIGQIGQSLIGLYQKVLASPTSEIETDVRVAESVLQGFIHPQQLYPIRLETDSC